MPYSHAFQIEQKRVGGGRDDTKRNDRERRKGKQRVGAARQLESNIYRNAAKKCTKRKKHNVPSSTETKPHGSGRHDGRSSTR